MSTANFDTFDAIGNREDLSEAIYMVSPTETPFFNSIGVEKATATLHEWQVDALAAAAANAHIQGQDTTGNDAVATTRPTNRSQISKKIVQISRTQETVDKAGRDSEMAYQTAQRLKELKRDMEFIVTGNQAVVTGDSTTASKLRSLSAWYTTNVSKAGDGGNGTTTKARTDGTQRAFTETLLLNLMQTTWDNGGDPSMLMTGSFNKRILSSFAGGASRTVEAEGQQLVQAIDLYVSDFGTLQVVPNRFSRARDAHALDPAFWAIAYIDTPFSEPLSKTGDSEKKHIVTEYTLEAKNEASSGIVADLTTS